MSSSKVLKLALPLLILASSLQQITGQSVTGQISGLVLDPSGAVVVEAAVELTSQLTKQARDFKTGSNGAFLFPNLVPGDYDLSISRPGFKTFVQKGINVAAQERVDVHALTLELGDVSTSVEVTAALAHVATDSSDRSVTVNTTQIDNTPSRGRNYLDILRSLPGTQATTSNDSRGIVSQTAPTINGGQQGQIIVTVGGITTQDSTAPGTGGYVAPSIDAIAEVKLLVSNYTAEYGARNGGQVNVTIKNGTGQFHGSAYYYLRHEMFNANEWFNNSNRLSLPIYRYSNPGGTIGGPLLIPGTSFNRSRTKLFFFFSEDYLRNHSTGAQQRFTMPTPLERGGDFSQTVTSTGALVKIIDPTTGVQFQGNQIPTSRISPQGYSLLNLFPLPFTSDPTGQRQYNTLYQWTINNPREDKLLRVDWNAGAKTTVYGVLTQDYVGNEGNGTVQGPQGSGWGQMPAYFDAPSVGMSLTGIHSFRANLLNETTWGISKGSETVGALDPNDLPRNLLPALKGPNGQSVTLPSAIAGTNPVQWIPKIAFTANGTSAQAPGQAVTNPPAFGWGGFWPFWGVDTLNTITNNTTWIKGSHTAKFGIYYEHDTRPFAVDGNYMGQYWFGSDTASPVDTGYAYSNALLGSIQSNQQEGARQFTNTHYNQWEWFAQDTWKIARRFTIDVGLRFQRPGPSDNTEATMGVFSGAAYSAAKSGQLLYPALVGGQKVALNPVTGATYSAARINSFDPASFPAGGNPFSGVVQYKDKFFNWPGIGIGPRVGFAWDVFGDGKTAIRGGFGISYGRAYNPNLAQNLQKVPPGYQSLTFYNTTFPTLLSTQATITPIAAPTGSPDYPNPSTNNWSFGVQRDLGKGFVADIAYVGNVAHHQFSPNTIDANAVKPYTTWSPTGGVNPKYQDPTNATGGLYNINLIRSLSGGYTGFGTLSAFTSQGESNYNALQVQVNRRFGRRFQMGTNYTWSKTITFARQQWIPDILTKNVATAVGNQPGQRPHVVNINFGFAIPDGSRLWKNAVSKQVLDGWNIAGVGSFYMGTPLTIGCAVSNVPANLGNYWTGTPTGGIPFRCQMTGDLWLADGATPASNGSTADPRLWYPFNAGRALSTNPGFVLPSATSLGFGNTPPTLTYGPGFENWDLSLYKEFKLGETRNLQLRVDSFNTFNHFNPSNPNSSLTYNFVTGAQTNANFGTITTAQNQARKASVSVKFRF